MKIIILGASQVGSSVAENLAFGLEMRRVSRAAWPHAPARSDGPPRCRLCGDDLAPTPRSTCLCRCARCRAVGIAPDRLAAE